MDHQRHGTDVILPPVELLGVAPARRRTPSQMQQSAPHAALMMAGPAGPTGPSDPYWANVVLLTTGDGVNGATTYPNLAGNPGPALQNSAGATHAELSNTHSEYGTTSIYVTPGSITTPVGDSPPNDDTHYGFGSSPWTFEMSAWVTGCNGASLFLLNSGTNTQALTSDCYTSANSLWVYQGTPDGVITAAYWPNTANQWSKFACVKYAGATGSAFYINGALVGTAAGSNPYPAAGRFIFGGTGMSAYVANIRVTKGVARYSGSTYTLPTGPFPTH